MSLVVARETPVAADPGECAFHDAALGQYDKTSNIAALHDLVLPAADERSHLGSAIAAIGDDALDERETPPRLPKQRFGAVAVLDIGGMDIDVQQQPSACHPNLLRRPGALARSALRVDVSIGLQS